MRLSQRHKNLILAAAVAFAAAVWLIGLNNLLPVNEDTSLYISMARSLAHGKGLFITTGPHDIPGNYYPFMYPALLAPFCRFLPAGFLVFKLFTVFLTVLFIAAVAKACQALFFRQFPLLVALFVCLSSQIALYSRSIQTEIPFTLFSFCAIWSLARYQEREGAFNRFFFFSAAFIFLSIYVRLIGVALLFAVPLWLAKKRQYSKAAASLSFFLLLVPWILRYTVMGSTYVDEFSGQTATAFSLAGRWLYNLACTVGKELPDLFIDPGLASIDPFAKVFLLKFALGCVLAYLLVKGFILKIMKEGAAFWDLYVFIYFFFLYLAWTTHGARYLVPVLVFLVYYLFIGLKSVARGTKVFYGACALLLALNVQGALAGALKERWAPLSGEESSFTAAADWIKANAPKDSIIMSRRPHWVNIYTGERGLRFLREKDTAKQLAHVLRAKPDYIIMDRNKMFRDDSRDYLLPLFKDYPGYFAEVFDSGGRQNTVIYRVKR
jgi:4-amino-4-deoxy-L-arabinose transferase-like glycosyltransferase